MKTQILDKQLNVIAEKETKHPSAVRVTYARVKYFSHSGSLPKSEIVSVPQIFEM